MLTDSEDDLRTSVGVSELETRLEFLGGFGFVSGGSFDFSALGVGCEDAGSERSTTDSQ